MELEMHIRWQCLELVPSIRPIVGPGARSVRAWYPWQHLGSDPPPKAERGKGQPRTVGLLGPGPCPEQSKFGKSKKWRSDKTENGL
jgi:hypothetical protein